MYFSTFLISFYLISSFIFNIFFTRACTCTNHPALSDPCLPHSHIECGKVTGYSWVPNKRTDQNKRTGPNKVRTGGKFDTKKINVHVRLLGTRE